MASPKKPYKELSKSAKYFRDNPEARKKKAAIDKEINARPDQIDKRVELKRKRREAERSGKDIKGKDFDHAVGKFVSVKKNRGRKGEGNRK